MLVNFYGPKPLKHNPRNPVEGDVTLLISIGVPTCISKDGIIDEAALAKGK
jgi:hypothetical protein